MVAKIKHLEFIQNVIDRMGRNSFALKGWSIIMLLILLALSIVNLNSVVIGIAGGNCIAFWCLDGYFLWQERMYRKLYQEVANRNPEAINFNMNAYKFCSYVDSWFLTCYSVTLLLLYVPIFASILLLMLSKIIIG